MAPTARALRSTAFAIAAVLSLGAQTHAIGLNASAARDNPYLIGSEWGKRVVTRQDLDSSPAFRRAAFATARVGGGTGFYLGKFAGRHVLATNHHVCPNGVACLGSEADFPLFRMRFGVARFLGTWSAIDLTLLELSVGAPEGERALASVARGFAFRASIFRGQPLLTIGFGSFANPERRMVANQDSDCKVFSGTDEFRLLADPDRINPGDYSAWSFANGCDVSHGDSGSAMIDRMTGEVVGIIWTGGIPKVAEVQDSARLDDLFRKQGGEIWAHLSYAVPAKRIGEVLYGQLSQPATPADTRAVIQAMLSE